MPKKKTEHLKTLVAVVLDESGSMYNIADETRGTFNQYFDDIERTDAETLVTVAEFSGRSVTDKVRFLCKSTNVKDMPYLDENNYRPGGDTPLLDAIGETIRAVENEKVDRFLLVILTDGFENASKEFTKDSIQKLIKEKEATDKWTVVYLGAGLDNIRREQQWLAASSLGFGVGSFRAPDATPGAFAGGLNALRGSTISYLSSTEKATTNFFQPEEDETEESEGLWTPDKVKTKS